MKNPPFVNQKHPEDIFNSRSRSGGSETALHASNTKARRFSDNKRMRLPMNPENRIGDCRRGRRRAGSSMPSHLPFAAL
jgi:hypothetical protein